MTERRTSRIVDAVLGAALIAVAVAILWFAWHDTPLGAAVASAIVGGLGLDAVVSAARDRTSLVSRIGPLP